MTLELAPDLADAITAAAARVNRPAEELAAEALRERFALPRRAYSFEPRDDWERALVTLPVDCGVSLPLEATTAEGMYG